MVHSPVLSGIFDAHHISDTFHHTDKIVVSRLIRTDSTDIIVRNHHTLFAVLHLIAHLIDSCSEMMNILRRLLEQMKSKTHSTSATHSRKGAYGIHSLFKKLGWIVFLIRHTVLFVSNDYSL